MLNETNDENPITPFAVTDFRDVQQTFGIKKRDRRGHMYVIGKTGAGKSTLIENMVVSDIRKGEGLALIDPHGDLAEEILHHVPESRLEDVVYFNPMDTEYPVAFNPLGTVPPAFRSLVVSGLISVFHKIWPDFWGPRLEHILRYALLTLLELPERTILDIPRLLSDKSFRMYMLKDVQDQPVRDFWFREFDKYTAWLKSEAISPILNKTGQFLASPVLRNIVGQSQNTFKLGKVMDEGKILVVNLAKGKIGEDTCSLLGSLMVNRIMLAAMSRPEPVAEQRKPFYVYVDELHNFLTLSFADMLSESRKYGLNLILAHQYIEQLDERIRAAIFGNVGTMISFRVGAEDARYLAKEFQPVFEEMDLINLADYHIYLKLMIDGVTCRPFSARTLPPPGVEVSHKAEIIEFSRAKYGRPRHEVEQDVLRG